MAISKKPKSNAIQHERAVDEFIEGADKPQQTTSKEGTVPGMIYWEPTLLARVDAERKKRGSISRSAYVQMLVARALDAGEG